MAIFYFLEEHTFSHGYVWVLKQSLLFGFACALIPLDSLISYDIDLHRVNTTPNLHEQARC